MNILMGPQGKLIRGHVLDVNEKRFNEALRFYDKQLYTKWNPSKLQGHGCWEIRRRPEFNSALDICEYEGNMIFVVGPKEYDLVHHIMDCAYLNYDALRKLKEIDTWAYGDSSSYQDEVERRTRDRREREKALVMEERKHMVRHYKKEISDFKEMIRGGVNPHIIAKYWDSVSAID